VLLVGNTDRIYLTDFGVAKPTTSAGLTRTGFFIGTPDYSAPEQIEGRDVDARTDIYALGAMLYTCLTGIAPYERDTEVAVLQAHLLEPPPRLRDQRPDLPRGLDRVIATAMAKAKEDRYGTCGDLMAAAEAAAHERSTRPAAGAAALAAQAPAEDEPVDPGETVLAPEAGGAVGGAAAAAAAAGTVAAAGSTPTAAAQGGADQREAAPDTGAGPATGEPPQAPPDTPAESPSDGSPRRKRGRLLVGLLVVSLIALVAALAAVLATRGGGSASGETVKGTTFNAPLSSSAEVPTSISTTSSGTANVTIDGRKVCWAFTLHGVDHPTAAHIHNGGPTVSGPVVVPLGKSFAQTGCTTAPANVTDAILASPATYYVNVHSEKYPDGAVRGQLVGGSKGGPTGSTSVHAVGLRGIVPAGIFSNCTIQAQPAPGAVQTAECVPPSNAQSFYPDHLQLSTFADTAALLKAYDAQRSAAGVGQNFGRCDRTTWGGEATRPARRQSSAAWKSAFNLAAPSAARSRYSNAFARLSLRP
jgi:hypothetical protein